MRTIELSETVNAPAARFFSILTDIERAPVHQPKITKTIKLTPGPVAVGTEWDETRRVMGSEATVRLKFTEFTPPDSCVITCASTGVRYDTRFDIRPRDGGCTISMTMTITPAGILGSIMAVLTKGAMKKALADDLATMKAAAESPA
jgi:hypothetical protein